MQRSFPVYRNHPDYLPAESAAVIPPGRQVRLNTRASAGLLHRPARLPG